MSLLVNRGKSGVLGSNPKLTTAMREAAGPLFGCTEALKDLGVVQGTGPAEQASAMARWSTSCNRLAKIAKLSMPMSAKGRFAAAAALSAGVYGTSCREQPDHIMETMRRWVRHALWQGGPAADYRILLWIGAVPVKADPVVAVLLAAARTVSLLVQDGHFTICQLEWLWLAADKCNPVAALRKALGRAGVQGSLTRWQSGEAVLEQPLQAYEQLRNCWLQEAQRQRDTSRVAACRPKLKLKGHTVQWQWLQLQLGRLKMPADRLAALVGVIAGDAVPELTAAKWNKGNGCCACGAPEDLRHRWWHCPRRYALRARALQGTRPEVLAALPACTREYGIPCELPEVTVWRKSLPQDSWETIPSSARYYVDGSCLRPRCPEVRVAAWAAVGWCQRVGWWSRAGPCPGLQTIGRAELAAVSHVLCTASPGTIVTDCLSVYNKCMSIQGGHMSKEEVLRSRNADLWGLCWGHLRSEAGWQFEWMPSHSTEAEASASGVSEADWLGNAKADEAAKTKAKEADINPQLLQRWSDHQAAVAAVWRLIAESQVAHLAGRARRSDGTAAKSRKRKAPARPARNVRRRALAAGLAAVQPLMAVPLPVQQQVVVAPFEWPVVPATPGVHQMQQEIGPVRVAGWAVSAAGALNCRWSCMACGMAAGNSSRLFEILRTPCGDHGEWRQLKHEASIVNGKMQCSRCGTERQKCIQLGLQSCPVRAFFQAGEEVPAATAVYAAWHRCVKAMHAYTKASGQQTAAIAAAVPVLVAQAVGVVVQEPVLEPRAISLRPFRSHVCVRSGEAEFCMMCFAKAPRYRVPAWRQDCCDGAAPIGSCPKQILAAISVCRVCWPPRHEGRGANIEAAATAWCNNHVSKQLRPPKRRLAARVV